MSTPISTLDLFELYVAYFGRPPDNSGVSGFARFTKAQVTAAFGASAESAALFSASSNEARVDAIYLNMFGRTAEAAGKAFWLNELSSGRITLAGMAAAIADGARNEDLLVLDAKVEVALRFSSVYLADSLGATRYNGEDAAVVAREFLSSIRGSTASEIATAKAAAISGLTAAVARVTAASAADDDNPLTGTSSADRIVGPATASLLEGFGGNDTLIGGAGNDSLEGGAGVDSLTGGAGADRFFFSADVFAAPTRALVASDADVITDFVAGTDKLAFVYFSDSTLGFEGLRAARTTAGGLDSTAFLSGSGAVSATSSAHRLVYDSSSGILRYDADGSGSGASLQVATLVGTPAISANDFSIVLF